MYSVCNSLNVVRLVLSHIMTFTEFCIEVSCSYSIKSCLTQRCFVILIFASTMELTCFLCNIMTVLRNGINEYFIRSVHLMG
jgi:hypothetical protein